MCDDSVVLWWRRVSDPSQLHACIGALLHIPAGHSPNLPGFISGKQPAETWILQRHNPSQSEFNSEADLKLTSCWCIHGLMSFSIRESNNRRQSLLQFFAWKLLLRFCSVCSSESDPRQSGTSGVLPECFSVREASQEKQRCPRPETLSCAEPETSTCQNPGQNLKYTPEPIKLPFKT